MAVKRITGSVASAKDGTGNIWEDGSFAGTANPGREPNLLNALTGKAIEHTESKIDYTGNGFNVTSFDPIADRQAIIDQACILWAKRGYSPKYTKQEFLEDIFNRYSIFLTIDDFNHALQDAGDRGLIRKVGRYWREKPAT